MGRVDRARFQLGQRLLSAWLPHPLGHFYSPVCDPADLRRSSARLWPAVPDAPGIDFRDDAQRSLLRALQPLMDGFDYPEATADPHGFFLGNSQFSPADARALFGLLRHWRPRRLVEVGSGYSTLLAADVNRRFLGGALAVVAIEPFPRPFLADLPGLESLRVEPVQHTPLAVFTALEAGDLLFIDSSHVLKTGSDLVFLLTRVLPCLARGVRIHLHDIFLPDDYPPEWAITLNRSWNEQYAVQAMLACNPRYRILFATHYAMTRLATEAEPVFGASAGQPHAGGSLWIEVQ